MRLGAYEGMDDVRLCRNRDDGSVVLGDAWFI